jgi:hypothetical protein
MNKSIRPAIVLGLTVGLALIGAGCVETADQTSETMVQGAVGTPLAALNQAKDLTAEQKAKSHRETAMVSNTVVVALTLVDGQAAPAGVELGETFGCQDRPALIEVSRVAATNQAVADALHTLFDIKETNYRELYNSLAFSDLKVDKVFMNDDGQTEVHISGEIKTGGTCDDPRVIAQVEETVSYYHPEFKVVLNDSDSAWRCLTDQSGLCQ